MLPASKREKGRQKTGGLFYLRSGLQGEVAGGGDDSLPARAGSGILRRSLRLKNVGHQTNLNAAVLGPAVSRGVGLSGFVFAQANHVNLVRRNALSGKILDHPFVKPFPVPLCIVG